MVDYGKLDQQIGILQRAVYTLASTNAPPTFVTGSPLATYSDAIVLRRRDQRAASRPCHLPGRGRGEPRDVPQQLDQIVAAGPAAFDNTAMGQLLSISLATVGYFTHGAVQRVPRNHSLNRTREGR